MTRKHTTKKQQFWSGTNTVKSENNAFDWKTTAKGLYSAAELAALQSGIKAKLNTEFKASIPTYSKAKPSGFTNR